MKGQLNRRLKGISRVDEITLFREINLILSKTFTTTLIEETHQHKVDYKSKAINDFVKREISDLLIIVFSRKIKKSKMTFLQAKYEVKNSFSKGQFSFKGDFFQYELLSTRPNIKNKSKFNFPVDILSFSNFDSIGSFGVFYKDGKGLFDMAYATAKDLSINKPVRLKSQKLRTLYFPDLPDHSVIVKADNINKRIIELRATQTINCFVRGLIGFLIGGEFINQRSAVQFLKSYFKGRPEITSQQFLEYLNENSDFVQGDNVEISGLGNVLLINIDEGMG